MQQKICCGLCLWESIGGPLLLINLVLAFSSIVMGWSLFRIHTKSRGRSFYLIIFGSLFFVLNVFIPLIVNAWCWAFTIRWGQSHRIVDSNVYMIYCLYVLSISFFYMLMSFVSIKKEDYDPVKLMPVSSLRVVQTVLGLGILLGFAAFVYGTGMSITSLMSASRFAWFEAGSAASLPLNIGLYLISLVSIYAFIDARLGFPNKKLSAFVYGSVILMIAVSGGRKWVIFVASGLMAGVCARQGGILIKFKYVVSILAAVVFMYSWQYGRNMDIGGDADFSHSLYQKATADGELFLKGDVSYFYRASLEAIDLNYNNEVFYPGAIVLRILLLPIPEAWTFGLKPKGIPELFAKDIGASNQARDGNMPPGLIGLFALSFGAIWGVFFFSLLIPLFLIFMEFRGRVPSDVFGMVFSAHFVSMMMLLLRGSTGGVYYMVFGVFFVFGAFFMVKVARSIL